MNYYGGYNFAWQVARRKALVAKWTAKYRAQGLSGTTLERVIAKRLRGARV